MNIGILGGGQLGWMTILEGRKYGFKFFVLDKNKNSPASRIADAWFPPEKVKEFCQYVDVITYEFEHIEDSVLENLSAPVYPPLEALRLKKSRIEEKTFLYKRGFPVPSFRPATLKELKETIKDFSLPVIVKSERLGYDGKGQYKIEKIQDLEEIYKNHSAEERFIVEEYVDFLMEVSTIAVRNTKGEIRVYPVTKNVHSRGILLYNHVEDVEDFKKEIEEIAKSLSEELSIVGLLAVEFFITKDGKVLINEFAPRPHNTGHYTLDSAYTSQFENLVRAITGLPLGSTELKTMGGMVNVLGLSYEEICIEEILSLEGTKLYWYGKEKRPRRKMGHINVVGKSIGEVKNKISYIIELLYSKEEIEV